jgi:phage terminase large subunit-like protein
VLRTRIWSARPDTAHHVFVPGGRIDNELAELFITDDLAKRYRVREVGYDPRFFDVPADHMSRAGLTVVEIQQQSSHMADAYQGFYSSATSGELAHDGDPHFAAHADACAAVETERGWKLYKLRGTHPFDAIVAASMAVWRLKVGKAGSPDIHWM